MIFFNVTSSGASFHTVLDCCKLADKLGFGVQVEVLGKTLQIVPGTNPHTYYHEHFYEGDHDKCLPEQ